jgi:hypothetical protein
MGESATPPVWSAEGRALALRRPARKQLDGAAPQERDRGAGGGEFNVWCVACSARLRADGTAHCFCVNEHAHARCAAAPGTASSPPIGSSATAPGALLQCACAARLPRGTQHAAALRQP